MLFNICIVVVGGVILLRLLLGVLSLFYMWLFCHMMKKRSLNRKNTEDGMNVSQTSKFSRYRRILSHITDGMIKYYMVKISNIPCHWLRLLFYKYIFAMDIADQVVIYKGCRFRAPYKIHIGANSVIGDDCILDGREGLYIGENVNLSSDVRVWTGQHSVNSSDFSYAGASVYIHDRAWISSNVIILPGCVVGRGAVLAAGAVLTQEAPEFCILGGGTG